jgi:hypothetical protein
MKLLAALSKTAIALAALLVVVAGGAAASVTGLAAGRPSSQAGDATQLLREASDLESRAAKLRQAVENCRRRVTPQSPDCQVYIEWQNAVVAYQEAERIAAVLEEQAREKRRKADSLQNQPVAPPPNYPVNTQPAVPKPQPVQPSPPYGGQAPAGQGTAQTPLTATTNQPAQPAPVSPPPRAGVIRIGGLSRKEWDLIRDYQRQIDEIYSRWPVAAGDVDRLDRLESARNSLWKKAVSVPGLTAEERQRLRLLLHTRS